MRELTQEEIKQIGLRLLLDVAAFCEERGLICYLAYGTLIGAVRHRGTSPGMTTSTCTCPARIMSSLSSGITGKS